MLQVGEDIDKGNPEMLRCEKPDRVIPPSRRQNDLCARGFAELQEPCQQSLVDNIRKLPRIVRSLAVENAINIQKDYFHQRSGMSGLFFAHNIHYAGTSSAPRRPRARGAYLGSLSAISLWCLSAVTVFP